MRIPMLILLLIMIVVIIFILFTLIPYCIRKRDFKRQIEGKIPERKLKNDTRMPYYNGEDLSPKSERDTPNNIRKPPSI